jgi:hypothetical protein
MLKTLGQFEIEIAGKIGRFVLDHDTTVEVAKAMCLEFIKMIGRIEDQAKAMQEAAKAAEEKPVEDAIQNEEIKAE